MQAAEPAGYVSALLGRVDWQSSRAICIEKDMGRLRVPLEPRQLNSVRNVLAAYSVRNPDPGYLSGHHAVAAAVVLALDEVEAEAELPELAFWCYAALLERVAPFVQSTDATSSVCACVAMTPPDVRRQVQHLSIQAGGHPLLSMRLYSVYRMLCADQGETGMRILDALLLCGEDALPRIYLALLERVEERLFACGDFHEADLLLASIWDAELAAAHADDLMAAAFPPPLRQLWRVASGRCPSREAIATARRAHAHSGPKELQELGV